MTLSIRRLTTHAERAQALALVTKGEPDEPAMQRPFTEAGHKAGHVVWGAFDGPILAGVCSAYKEPGDQKHYAALHLTMAYVHPSYRGAGLQGRFIRVRLAYGRRAKCRIALTYTHARNPGSQISLLKAGFVPYSITSHGAYVSFAKRL